MPSKMIGMRLDEKDAVMFDELAHWIRTTWPSLKLNDAEVMRFCLREAHKSWRGDREIQDTIVRSAEQQKVEKKVRNRLKKLADDQGVS